MYCFWTNLPMIWILKHSNFRGLSGNIFRCCYCCSHDRYFLDKVTDTIFEFEENGTLKQFLGGYSDYFNTAKTDYA